MANSVFRNDRFDVDFLALLVEDDFVRAEFELQEQTVGDDEDEGCSARLLGDDGNGGGGEERGGGGEGQGDDGYEEEGLHGAGYVFVEELLLAAGAAGAECYAGVEEVGGEDVADEGCLESFYLVTFQEEERADEKHCISIQDIFSKNRSCLGQSAHPKLIYTSIPPTPL